MQRRTMFISLFIAILLIITAFMLIIPPDKTPSPHNFKPVSRIIIANVSIAGTNYMEKITYSPEDFPQILKNLSSVENSLLKDFRSRVSSYNIEIVDLKVRVLDDSYSLLLSCFVKGNVWSTSSGFTADMSWLINPLGLDLIDDHFEETNHSLEWKGNLQGIIHGDIHRATSTEYELQGMAATGRPLSRTYLVAIINHIGSQSPEESSLFQFF